MLSTFFKLIDRKVLTNIENISTILSLYAAFAKSDDIFSVILYEDDKNIGLILYYYYCLKSRDEKDIVRGYTFAEYHADIYDR